MYEKCYDSSEMVSQTQREVLSAIIFALLKDLINTFVVRLCLMQFPSVYHKFN
jgi:hypothetical protein